VPVKTQVQIYSLDRANDALQDLRDGKVEGAAVLSMARLNAVSHRFQHRLLFTGDHSQRTMRFAVVPLDCRLFFWEPGRGRGAPATGLRIGG